MSCVAHRTLSPRAPIALPDHQHGQDLCFPSLIATHLHTHLLTSSLSQRVDEMNDSIDHPRNRIRTTSFIADENPYVTTLAMQFHADRWISRLDRLSPPRWKSQEELYEDANWKAGMRMTPCTPTPSATPSPAASPYMFSIDKRYDTPSSISPPPSARLQTTKDFGNFRITSRKNSKSSISKPNRVAKRTASKHSMITRSRCRGNCLRHEGCVRSRQNPSRTNSDVR
jgi:hypothetical protein